MDASTPGASNGRTQILYTPNYKDPAASGISLWVNPSTHDRAPQYTGQIHHEGKVTQIAAWLKQSEHGAFLSISTQGKRHDDGNGFDKSESLGTANAHNQSKDGVDYPADKNPFMAAKVKLDGKDVRVTGFVSNNAEAIAHMERLGFKPQVIANFTAKVNAKASAGAGPRP